MYTIEKTRYSFGIDYEDISQDMIEMYCKAQEACYLANSEFDIEDITEYDTLEEAIANKPENEYEALDNYAPKGKETLFCGTWYIITKREYDSDGGIVDVKEIMI